MAQAQKRANAAAFLPKEMRFVFPAGISLLCR
jgi:hypothetical protein